MFLWLEKIINGILTQIVFPPQVGMNHKSPELIRESFRIPLTHEMMNRVFFTSDHGSVFPKTRLFHVAFKMIPRRQGGGDVIVLFEYVEAPTTLPTQHPNFLRSRQSCFTNNDARLSY